MPPVILSTLDDVERIQVRGWISRLAHALHGVAGQHVASQLGIHGAIALHLALGLDLGCQAREQVS